MIAWDWFNINTGIMIVNGNMFVDGVHIAC